MPEKNDAGRLPLTILVFSGSLRSDSLNTRLASNAARVLTQHGVTVDLRSLQEFNCPAYDGDVERRDGVPSGAEALKACLDAADGFVLATPEYNASIPGVLKNLIDWTSRFRPQPFHQKQCLLLSASPSMVGGNRGAWAARIPLEHLGSRVYPDMFSLAQAHTQLDADGNIELEVLKERFESTIVAWIDLVEAEKHFPCAKARWIEILGEKPQPEIDRVQ